MPLTPTHYYKLDESSGNAADSVGGVTLTNTNTATYEAAKINNGARFLASSQQYLSAANNLGYDGGAFSMVGWYIPKAQPASNFAHTMAFVKDAGSKTYIGVEYLNSAGSLRVRAFRDRVGVSGVSLTSIQTLSDDVAYHIGVTYDASTIKLYVNASEEDSDTASGDGTGSPASVIALGTGLFPAVDNPATGVVDEWYFENRGLSGTEITQLYNGGAGISYPFPTSGRYRTLLGAGT